MSAVHCVKVAAKNGYYIPPLVLAIYSLTQNLYLASAVGLKLCSLNYYCWYYPEFDYRFQDRRWNSMKQMVRFTDTGHFVNLLYLTASPSWGRGGGVDMWPTAFNVHFVITFGYWAARLCFGMKDALPNDAEYNAVFEDFCATMAHGWHFVLLIFELRGRITANDTCPYYGKLVDAWFAWCWLLVWFLCLYIPWRTRTGDPIYSVVDKKSSIPVMVGAGVMIQVLVFVGNWTAGWLTEILG
jgi:hypothetical protein